MRKRGMMKKVTVAALASVMAVGLLAGCGGGGAAGGGGSTAGGTSGGASSGDGVAITIFNSKMEIQEQMEEMAAKYSEEKGVAVEVYYSSDTVAAHMSTKYASNDPYTVAMVDAKDIYSLGPEHAIDLSGEDWVKNTQHAISVDGKVLGFPVCVEARGIIYNADAIEAATGETFDPKSIKTTDDFKAIIDKLIAGGMEAPVGVMKEDWSLGAHFLQEVYEEQEDVDGFITKLHAGEADLANNEKFNLLMDTFDVLKENNYAKASAISAEREVTEQKLAEGEIAFMFGGNWDWSVINAYEYSENMGMMPVPQNSSDGSNEKLVGGGSKFFFIDSSEHTTDEQRQAGKDFLNWLVSDEAGQSFLVDDCALVPAFSNITLAVGDPLGASVKEYADSGSLIPNYDYAPDDHYAVCGASFQKYLADQTDRAGLAAEIEEYWKKTTPVEH